MKARLVPIYFQPGRDEGFDQQLQNLKGLLAEEAEFLEPLALGSALPSADAVVFPQLLGEAYRQVKEFQRIHLPILLVTSEFGTILMWDWEIASFLRAEGVCTFAPSSLEETRKILKCLQVKRELRQAKFLVFQDNPGEGHQADIFKRFYWWEEQCIGRLKEKLGVTLEKKSYKALAGKAKRIPDAQAEEVWRNLDRRAQGLSTQAINSAVKLYLAVKEEVEQDAAVKSCGINCLNESRFSDTTPCLAWDLLFQEMGLIWGCEADLLSMATKYILHKPLNAPILMTNIYPFLMGMAALKHERISNFPEIVEEPENHVLLAHCGYLGVLPRCYSTEWSMKPKVLAIVDENAHALDARLPAGDATLVKLDPTLKKLLVLEGNLKGYVQYPGSDCRNGAILKISDGHKMLDRLYSHHVCLMPGRRAREIEQVARIFELELDRV